MYEYNELKGELYSLQIAFNKHKDDSESYRNEQIIDNEAKEIEIAALKTSIEATQTSIEAANALILKQKSEIDQLRMERKNDLCKIRSLNDQVEQLRKQSEMDHHRLVYVEDSSRRSSLRFRGVPEQPWETWEQCQAKILRFLKENIGISPEIERAHRIGKIEREINRDVIVKFLRYPDKEYIFNNRHRLSSSGIFVKQDFSNDTAQLRRSFQGDIREAREKGLIAYAKYRSLVVHPPRSDGPHRGGRGRGRGGANRGARRGQGVRGARGGTGAESASKAGAGHSATPMTLQPAIIGQPAVPKQPAAPEQLAASELPASEPPASEPAASEPAASEQLAASEPPAHAQPAAVEHLDSPKSNEKANQVSQSTRSKTVGTNWRSDREEPKEDIFSGFSSDSDNATSATAATAIRLLTKRRAPEPSSASPSPSKKQEKKKKRKNGKKENT